MIVRSNPAWRHSDSGESRFYDECDDTFVDPAAGSDRCGAAKAVALGKGIIGTAADDLAGAEWWQVVEELRAAGYDVPVYTPDADAVDSAGEQYGVVVAAEGGAGARGD